MSLKIDQSRSSIHLLTCGQFITEADVYFDYSTQLIGSIFDLAIFSLPIIEFD